MNCLFIDSLMNRWKTYQQLFVLVIGIMIVPMLFSYSSIEKAGAATMEIERIAGEELEVIILWDAPHKQVLVNSIAGDASGVEILATDLAGNVLLHEWVGGRFVSDYPIDLSAFAEEDVFIIEVSHGKYSASSMLLAKK